MEHLTLVALEQAWVQVGRLAEELLWVLWKRMKKDLLGQGMELSLRVEEES